MGPDILNSYLLRIDNDWLDAKFYQNNIIDVINIIDVSVISAMRQPKSSSCYGIFILAPKSLLFVPNCDNNNAALAIIDFLDFLINFNMREKL